MVFLCVNSFVERLQAIRQMALAKYLFATHAHPGTIYMLSRHEFHVLSSFFEAFEILQINGTGFLSHNQMMCWVTKHLTNMWCESNLVLCWALTDVIR